MVDCLTGRFYYNKKIAGMGGKHQRYFYYILAKKACLVLLGES